MARNRNRVVAALCVAAVAGGGAGAGAVALTHGLAARRRPAAVAAAPQVSNVGCRLDALGRRRSRSRLAGVVEVDATSTSAASRRSAAQLGVLRGGHRASSTTRRATSSRTSTSIAARAR